MDNIPLVTFVTINKNNANGLKKTLDSFVNQSNKSFDVIIVDGASVDNSLEVINEYSDIISLHLSEQDSGIYDAMNKGLAYVKTEYVYYLNSGDYLYDKDVFKILVSSLDPSLDAVYGNIAFMAESGLNFNKPSKKINLKKGYEHALPYQPALLLRKILLDKVGGFPLEYKYISDVVVIFKIFHDYDIIYRYIDTPFCLFDLSGVSGGLKNQKKIYKERLNFLKKDYPQYKKQFAAQYKFRFWVIYYIRLLMSKISICNYFFVFFPMDCNI